MMDIKRILIVLVNEMGHLLPSFRIAKMLQNDGYNVTYAVQLDKAPLIASLGFEYVVSPIFLFRAHTSNRVSLIDSFDGLANRFFNRISKRELQYTEQQLALFEYTVKKVNPNLIFLDSFLTHNYLLLKSKPPVILFQTMLSTYKDVQVPPLTSHLIPGRSFWHQVAVNCAWRKYYLTSWIVRAAYFGDTVLGITERLAKKRGIDVKGFFARDKTFHIGLKQIPEVILSPKCFDFPRKVLRKNQMYAGLCSDVNRIDQDIDPAYEPLMRRLPSNSIIVYCSLGTLTSIHFKGAMKFYQKLMNVFRGCPELQLILSIGSIDTTGVKNVPPNVHIFIKVPQMLLLKRANIMITHGGLNSVLECVSCGTPMLVYPLSNTWDQNGNAARVVYHAVGLRGNIRSVSQAAIKKQINKLINNPNYSMSIEKLRASFLDSKVSEQTIGRIMTIAKNINNRYGQEC